MRETDIQRDREKERQRDRETERQRDRETERQRDRETERQRDRETERQRDRERERDREAYSIILGNKAKNIVAINEGRISSTLISSNFPSSTKALPIVLDRSAAESNCRPLYFQFGF